ncbi:glycoside hydrolase family 3 protein [Pelagibacterium halotolerans]|uniref:beta-N-acetylhexosaminidase n=1 Tax=Pelagibacterium halotolerans (strain DSM 22347 / JCM 15775 / CGMCC 1.7692 / B2) TaxID=1082931 RepID=G4R7D8_PELHB|nr:glycoside hydrolase family 3 N-terminal domain-containing protein [Pelagibacterium halotolerans]AEQ51274.1 beta-hexosaminidase [Pelagibacterium halotolerans B2]QJR18869.1 glycoside hydrolase family 3 protein [Pelagibacterium halotolerans]SEA66711.1 beta-N-acetylhexosaminidase [Pelagibacterium halotolerans]
MTTTDYGWLEKAPFHLDAEARSWVHATRDAMSIEDKVAQLFVLISRGDDDEEQARIRRLRPGGITRFFGPDAEGERGRLAALQSDAAVPLLVSADLEGSRMSLPFATQVPNPLALAALDDVAVTRDISRIMAEEARAIGVNWSFTPVVDINAAFRSAIVATRGFGSDVETIERHALAQIEEFQKRGVAATVKHWPGEGFDDRDQHLVTTINPLSMPDWEEHFGRLYRAAIAKGVLSVMSAHIALPAYVRSLNPDAGIEAFRPASVSRLLNIDLLRHRLGFNGLIVSDASEMAGLGAWMPLRGAKPQIIANGCDVILFSRSPEEDMDAVRAAVENGEISRVRLDDAITRILALKARLGLHDNTGPDRRCELGAPEAVQAASAAIKGAPTLVKDVQNLVPIAPATHKRVLIFSGGIVSPLHGEPAPMVLPQLLADNGFEVTLHTPGTVVTRENFDLVLYIFGEETLLTRGRIFLDWAKIGGDFGASMQRHWHDIPTAIISFGYPYYLYDAPRVPTYINAYSTLDAMQAAVVDLLLGDGEFNSNSPIDPFAGLEDARY